MQGLVRDNGTDDSNAAKLLLRAAATLKLSMFADSRANFRTAVGRAELEILRPFL